MPGKQLNGGNGMQIILNMAETNDGLVLNPTQRFAGNDGDNRYTNFVVKRLEKFKRFICRVEFSNRVASSHFIVIDDTFPLYSEFTDSGWLNIQLVYTDIFDNIVAKTNTLRLTIGSSINAVDEASQEFQDSIAQLASDSMTSGKYEDGTLTLFNRTGQERFSAHISGTNGQQGESFDPTELEQIIANIETQTNINTNDINEIQINVTDARNIANTAANTAATAGYRAEDGIRRADAAQHTANGNTTSIQERVLLEDFNIHTSNDDIHVTAEKQTYWNSKNDNLFGLFVDVRTTATVGYWHKLFDVNLPSTRSYTDINICIAIQHLHQGLSGSAGRGNGILNIAVRQESNGAIGNAKLIWSSTTIDMTDYLQNYAINIRSAAGEGNTVEFYVYSKTRYIGVKANVISMSARGATHNLLFTGYTNWESESMLTTIPETGSIIYSELSTSLKQINTNTADIASLKAALLEFGGSI